MIGLCWDQGYLLLPENEERLAKVSQVAIYAATHEVEIESRRNDIEYTGPVTIGNDCWIGANTIILPG